MRLVVAIAVLMMVSGCNSNGALRKAESPSDCKVYGYIENSPAYHECVLGGGVYSRTTEPERICDKRGLKWATDKFRACVNKEIAKNEADYEKMRKRQERAALDPYRERCSQMGFKAGGEKMAGCILHLQENAQAMQQRQSEANRAYTMQQRAYEAQRSDAMGGLGLAILGGGLQPQPAYSPTTSCRTEWRGGRAYTTCY